MDNTLGKNILFHRKRLGMTQDQLAEKLGVTAQAVSKWENDLSCPDITTIPKLAAIFGITTDSLLTGQPEEPVREAEVVVEPTEPKVTDNRNSWEFSWNPGKRGSLTFAFFVLVVGVQLLLAPMFKIELSFWTAVWTSALTIFGLFGVLRHPSFLKIGCLFFGAYSILNNWNLLPFSYNKGMIFPVVIILFGLSLLADGLKKPRIPKFRFKGNGTVKNDCEYTETGFEYKGSFGDHDQEITLPLLNHGRISTSFGDYTIDLSGVTILGENAKIDASISFGELTILVPRRFAVKQTNTTAFGAFEIIGHPDPEPHGVLTVHSSTNFGETTIKYI